MRTDGEKDKSLMAVFIGMCFKSELGELDWGFGFFFVVFFPPTINEMKLDAQERLLHLLRVFYVPSVSSY